MIKIFTILSLILFPYNLYSQYVNIHANRDFDPVCIYPKMVDVDCSKKTLLFESTDEVQLDFFLRTLKNNAFDSFYLRRVDYFKSNKSNYWMLIPIELFDIDSLGTAILAYGCQNDSIWILNRQMRVTQMQKIPIYNFKKDLTGVIQVGNLPGIALNLKKDDKFILINTKNYAYGKSSIPVLFDVNFYTEWYFNKYLFKLIFFLFICGIELGLILYFLLHYYILREKYLLWYILYVFAQTFPNLDYIHWAFSDYFSFPYSWFNFKVFHLTSIMISYLFFIKNIISDEIIVFNKVFKILIPLCVIVFLTDTILLVNGYEYLSGLLYFYSRSFLGLFSLLAISLIFLFYYQKKYRLLFIGSSCIIVSEVIGWLFFSENRTYIINVGILIEYLFFSYFINLIIRDREKERLYIKSENLDLLKKQEELKQNIAQDIHDEVGSIITKLNLELQLEKLRLKDSKQLEIISNYQKYVEKIRVGLSDLIQIIDNKTYDFIDLCASVREIASDYLDNTAIKLDMDIYEQQYNPKLSYQIKRNLESVLKEILQNILKHSKATNVNIYLSIDQNQIIFKVKDNGIGIPPFSNSNGKGILNMQKRIQKLRGSITINSFAKGNGTFLDMRIPV